MLGFLNAPIMLEVVYLPLEGVVLIENQRAFPIYLLLNEIDR